MRPYWLSPHIQSVPSVRIAAVQTLSAVTDFTFSSTFTGVKATKWSEA